VPTGRRQEECPRTLRQRRRGRRSCRPCRPSSAAASPPGHASPLDQQTAPPDAPGPPCAPAPQTSKRLAVADIATWKDLDRARRLGRAICSVKVWGRAASVIVSGDSKHGEIVDLLGAAIRARWDCSLRDVSLPGDRARSSSTTCGQPLGCGAHFPSPSVCPRNAFDRAIRQRAKRASPASGNPGSQAKAARNRPRPRGSPASLPAR